MSFSKHDSLGCLIRLAFFETGEAEAEAYQGLDVTDVTVSAALDRRVHRRIRREERRARHTDRRVPLTLRLLAAVLAILVLLTVTVSAIPEVRQVFRHTLIRWTEEYLALSPVPNAPPVTTAPSVTAAPSDILNAPYTLPDLGEAYTAVELIRDPSLHVVEFYDGEALYCTYMREPLAEQEIWFNEQGAELERVMLYGKEWIFVHYPEEKINFIVWTDATFYYQIDGNLSDARLMELALSVR